MKKFLKDRDRKIRLDRPLLMAILNVTPDSFSDGGKLYSQGKLNIRKAIAKGIQMAQEGADIIDIGGEATGPTSHDVPLEEELQKVVPVVKALRKKLDSTGYTSVWISVDTHKAEVAKQAIKAGAKMINDVTALRGDLKMASIIADTGVSLIIMYSKDKTPRTTKKKVTYKDVVKSIKKFLEERIRYGRLEGIKRSQFVIDPGMGAFVSGHPKYSLEILGHLEEFENFQLPILIGASRKGFIGELLGQKSKPLKVTERLEGSLACAAIAVMNGAHIIRAHDVKETRKVVDIAYQIKEATKRKS